MSAKLNGHSTGRHVSTTVNYFLETPEKVNDAFYLGTVGERRRKHDTAEVTVEDIRGREGDFSLDVQGFQLVSNVSSEKAFADDGKIKAEYYPECETLLKTTTKATRVIIMGHTIRRRDHDVAMEEEKDLPDLHAVGGPTNARWVHVDQSYLGAQERLAIYAGSDAQQLSQTRWAIINIWRAIKPVERDNLAFCDARSVSEEDLHECVAKFVTRDNERDRDDTKDYANMYTNKKDNHLWGVKRPADAGGHRWYYASKMTPDEALLLKIFDSRLDGTARRTPHTAFKCEEDHGPTRESLETRCLVFWET
ncbi:hypothetical protein PRZ48_006884 [Zasmidium cellare]|uniref:GA4 desaturase family protein n=1 Tax=Zasmidium cellare TaxID=395010 RepID=A0ABR0EIQ0_ZASCE|nr:hypothetical protein PRZ48_006884 [Zasmidium cellare]